jgi:hypothetical protein
VRKCLSSELRATSRAESLHEPSTCTLSMSSGPVLALCGGWPGSQDLRPGLRTTQKSSLIEKWRWSPLAAFGEGGRGGNSISHRLTIKSKRYRCWEYHQAPECNTCKRLVPMFVTGLFTPHASPSLPLTPCRAARIYPSNAGPSNALSKSGLFSTTPLCRRGK